MQSFKNLIFSVTSVSYTLHWKIKAMVVPVFGLQNVGIFLTYPLIWLYIEQFILFLSY